MPLPYAAHRDYDLPPDATRVTVTGPARTLAWPAMCPNCGEPASTPIRVYKVFMRKTRRRPWHYHIRSIEIPYCERCTREHHALVKPPGAFTGWLAVFRSPLIISLIGAAVIAYIGGRDLIEGLFDPSSRMIAFAIVGTIAAAALSSIIGAWWSFRYDRMPKQTDITRACDFSDNLGNIFIGQRRVFAIRNARFAEAFAAANRDRLLTDALRKRDERRNSIAAVGGLGLLVVVWWLFGRKRK